MNNLKDEASSTHLLPFHIAQKLLKTICGGPQPTAVSATADNMFFIYTNKTNNNT